MSSGDSTAFSATAAATGAQDGQAALLPLQQLFASTPSFACMTRGPQHVVELVSQSWHMLACHRDIVGMPIRQALPEPASSELVRLLDQVYASQQATAKRACKLKRQPSPEAASADAYIDFIFQPLLANNGSVAGTLTFGHDVTKEVQANIGMLDNEERFHLVMDAAGDGVWDWYIPENKFVFSARGREMLGYAPNEIGPRLDDWLAITHHEDQERIRTNTMACLKGRLPFFSAEYRVRCKDGSWKWLLSRGAVVQRNPDGLATRMLGTTIDISTKQEILRRANFDSLTRLPNRNLFFDRLEREVRSARRTGKSFALLFLDLDRFKEVNDLLGHDAGDKLLRQCADRICSCVRSADTVARLGGDEFTVILIDLESRAHVEDVAQKILNALALPFHLGEQRVHVSASIGITLHPDDGDDQERLVQNADQAMYVAKNAGRNQFHFFTCSMQEQARYRITTLAELRNALPHKELRVYFQPVVNLTNATVMKAEALLRWQHPQRGLLLPSEFISLAEESGLIHEIGNWVFVQSSIWSKRWNERTGEQFQVSVNVSPIQFMQRKRAMNWGHHLSELGLASNSVSVEITEGVLFNTSSTTEEQLMAMRNAGIQVAIDDFGTGYSSMAYLKKFDVDYLKIDQSFVRATAPSSSSRTIAETIIVMAHKLGLQVIAEGVETPEQRDWLQHAGCDFGQGFLFSKPLPPEDFERLLPTAAPLL